MVGPTSCLHKCMSQPCPRGGPETQPRPVHGIQADSHPPHHAHQHQVHAHAMHSSTHCMCRVWQRLELRTPEELAVFLGILKSAMSVLPPGVLCLTAHGRSYSLLTCSARFSRHPLVTWDPAGKRPRDPVAERVCVSAQQEGLADKPPASLKYVVHPKGMFSTR